MSLAPAISSPRAWWMYLFRNRVAVSSGFFILVALILALIGPPLYRGFPLSDRNQARDGFYQDYNSINALPSADHWLGADYLGRDTLTRLFFAVRVSLLVALVVETINVLLGGALGLAAGYFGGWVDMLISRAADML